MIVRDQRVGSLRKGPASGTIWVAKRICVLMVAWVGVWPLPSKAQTVSDARWHSLDLSQHYQERFSNAWPSAVWSGIPTGTQTLGGIPFQVDGLLRLSGLEAVRQGEWAPSQITGITIGRTFQYLHLLHGLDGSARDGTPVMSVVFHYVDGSEQTLRLTAGVHVRSVNPENTTKESGLIDSHSRVAWSLPTQSGARRSRIQRLFLTTLSSPKPDRPVAAIDLVSFFSPATPVLFALTLESGQIPAVGPGTPQALHRLVRRADAIPETALRAALEITASDGSDGASNQTLTNAEAFLAVFDGERRFFLDRQRADSRGRIRLWYPPAETVAYSVVLRAPGYATALLDRSRLVHDKLSANWLAELKPGISIGGNVASISGEAIAGATVAIYTLKEESKREITRVDYDVVKTDSNGRWQSSALVEPINGYHFEVKHPEFMTTFFQADGSATGARMISSEVLVKGEAKVQLAPAPHLAGTVMNTEGKGVAGAAVFGVFNGRRPPKRLGGTDAGGSFALRFGELEGANRLLFQADGFVPALQNVDGSDPSDALRVVLSQPKPLIGLVRDQGGNPVPGAEIHLDSWNETDLLGWKGMTDEQGRFTWTNAAPGMLGLRLSKTNYYRARFQMAWEDGPLTLSLQRQSMAFGQVTDASTGKPVSDFTVIPGIIYNRGDRVRWDRYNPVRGRNGNFAIRLERYGGSDARAMVMVEAHGYLPAASPEFSRTTWITNDFKLQQGRGISGAVIFPNGAPAPNVSLVLIDGQDSAYLEKPGLLSRSSSYSDQTRTDKQGRFEFQPRLNPSRVVAVSEVGVADLSVEDVTKQGRLVLQPWGRVEGIFRVGAKWEPNQSIRLQSFYHNSYDGSPQPNGISINFRAIPDSEGRFVFPSVPPGERQVLLEYKFSERRNGPIPLSHGVVVDVVPGGTNQVTLGGGGRRVEGRVRLLGGDPEMVNWLNDVHTLQLQPPPPPGQPSMSFTANESAESRATKEAEYRKQSQKFWNSPAGLAFQRQQRSYVLVFDTNGAFHADNIPAGRYSMRIAPQEQQGEYYSYRELGSLQREVIVPEGGQENEPFDLGVLDLRIRGRLKVGKPAPEFEVPDVAGDLIRSSSLHGKTAVLYFWATWSNPTSDLNVLKALQETQGKTGKFILMMINVDTDKAILESFLKSNALPGTICFAGDWSVSPAVGAFGVDGFPSAVVIDPEGKISAFNVRGNSIRGAVSRAMKSLPAAAKK